MRFAITNMATSGCIPGNSATATTTSGESDSEVRPENGNIVTDLRTMRASFEALDPKGGYLERDVGRKMEVMRTCVEKVEMAVYGMIVRGRERPRGWVMEERVGEQVESY